ncbi:MAG: type II secretion system protein GspC [Gammaproteobacteria bacterium]|nr:type II secretion system protein GspC [Gammaproteobacteria bacterium]
MKLPAFTFQSNESLKLLQHFSPPVLSILLLFIACYTLAEITWQLLEPAASIQTAKKNTSGKQPAKNNNNQFQKKLIQLNNAHLFGQADAPLNKHATKDAPETTLNLLLRGVLATQPMKLATAIISAGKNAQELSYGIGDSVPGNATIEEIYPTRVILMRNGKLETLKLPEESVGDIESTQTDSSGLNLNQAPGQVLGDIRRDILKNPTSFGEYAIPVPVSKNGKLQGYRLRPQKKGKELFEQFGLQRNDIVTSINGIQLNDPVQGISALKKLSSATDINLTVLRNGAETPLQFSIR